MHVILIDGMVRKGAIRLLRTLAMLTWLACSCAIARAQGVVEEKGWSEDFAVVNIASSIDGHVQQAYFYRAQAEGPRPLIVSLHTWSGSYSQSDPIAELSKKEDVNYIHPDFRGPNNSKEACCSALALNDIDDAISWALQNSSVDTSRIYVLGVSGGGYATLSTFMRSKHRIRKFSAWAAITDLVAWYDECRIRKYKYADDILKCTNSSEDLLNTEEAIDRSPLYWETPLAKIQDAEVHIYAGIHDGVTGSVPFTHSIRFYNKLMADTRVKDSSAHVSDVETETLLRTRLPLGEFGNVGDRRICLKKSKGNTTLVIFEGGHEMLTAFAFYELLR